MAAMASFLLGNDDSVSSNVIESNKSRSFTRVVNRSRTSTGSNRSSMRMQSQAGKASLEMMAFYPRMMLGDTNFRPFVYQRDLELWIDSEISWMSNGSSLKECRSGNCCSDVSREIVVPQESDSKSKNSTLAGLPSWIMEPEDVIMGDGPRVTVGSRSEGSGEWYVPCTNKFPGKLKVILSSGFDSTTNCKDASGPSEGWQVLSAEQTLTVDSKSESLICCESSPRLDPGALLPFGTSRGVGGGKAQQIFTLLQPLGDRAGEVNLVRRKRFRILRMEVAGEESVRDCEISNCRLLLLPDDIQSIIYAKLPLPDVYRLQSCCRQLRHMRHFESFKQARAHESPSLEGSYSPIFFSVHEGGLEMAGYNITLGEWNTLPSLKCLPSPDPGLLKEFLIAGAEGLLCITVGKAAASEAPKLIICNPLTQQIRELPAMNFPRHPVLMHLIVDKKNHSYKVIVAGSSTVGTEHVCRKTEVYCSKTRSWQVTGDLPEPDFGLNEYQNGAYSNGVLYCVALSSVTGRKVVLAYHVAKGIWLPNWFCPIPTFRSHAYFATTQIVGLGGSIFVFSEQEYLKEVKTCIEKLEFIQMKSHKSQKERWRCNPEIPEHHERQLEETGTTKHDKMWSDLMNVHTDPVSWEKVLTEEKKGKWTNLLQETKQGSRGLMVYPEYTCVSQASTNKLCIFNTMERKMSIYDLKNICSPIIQTTTLQKCKKNFHSLNPLAFTFTPNFNAQV